MSTDLAARPSSRPLFQRPRALSVFAPKEKGWTADLRKLYACLLFEAQRTIRHKGAPPLATEFFLAAWTETLESAGISVNSRSTMKARLKALQRITFEYETFDEQTQQFISGEGPLIGETAFSDGFIHYQLPVTLVRELAEPRRWSMQDLKTLVGLETYAAVALYDLACLYRNNPGQLTHRESPGWWVHALSPVRRSREWRKFKAENVVRAIEEINEKTDLELELIEHKEGKAVAEVQFRVRQKQPATPHAGRPGPDARAEVRLDPRIARRLENLNFEDRAVGELLDVHSVDAVCAGLDQLHHRLAQTHLPPVLNPLSYLKSMLAPVKVSQLEVLAEGDQPPTARPPVLVVEEPPVPNPEPVRTDPLAGLSDAQRAELLGRLEVLMRGKGVLTPAAQRRIRAGDVSSPLLRLHLAELLKPD